MTSRKASALEGVLEGSLAMWQLWLVEDCAGSETTGVAVLSNWGLEVNSSSVLAITEVARISWKAIAMAR